MAEVATPGAAATSMTLNQTGDNAGGTTKTKRDKMAPDGEGKREALPADEFTKATFTAAQKVLREQRSDIARASVATVLLSRIKYMPLVEIPALIP